MFQTRKKHFIYIRTLSAISFWDCLHTWAIVTSYPLPSCPPLFPTASSPLLLQSYFLVTHQGNRCLPWTWQLQIPQDSKKDSREQTNYFVLHLFLVGLQRGGLQRGFPETPIQHPLPAWAEEKINSQKIKCRNLQKHHGAVLSVNL